MSERKIAYKVINKVLKNNEMSSSLLRNEANKIKRNNGNHEFFYKLTKGVIKRKLFLEYICTKLTNNAKYEKTDLKIKILLYIGIYQIIYMNSVPEHAAVDTTVQLAKDNFSQKTADFVNAILRNYLRNPNIELPKDDVKRIAIEQSYPESIIKQWIDAFGTDDAEYLAMYFNENPELNIRINNTATNINKLSKYFEKRNISLTPYPTIKDIFKVTPTQNVLDDVAFSEGYYSVQDAAAALVVQLADPQKEDNIIDFFAGPGGKVTYCGEIMQNKGQIIAIDKFPKKVKLIKRNVKRLALTNINLVTSDALQYKPVAPAYDKVFLDVPCSGWGVFGKKSELRWQTHQQLNDLLKLQQQALIYGSKFVKVGGHMIYSTCTMNPKENEEQVNKFLKRFVNFELVDASNFVDSKYTKNGFLRTIPHIHQMDGAFGAKLRRIQ